MQFLRGEGWFVSSSLLELSPVLLIVEEKVSWRVTVPKVWRRDNNRELLPSFDDKSWMNKYVKKPYCTINMSAAGERSPLLYDKIFLYFTIVETEIVKRKRESNMIL